MLKKMAFFRISFFAMFVLMAITGFSASDTENFTQNQNNNSGLSDTTETSTLTTSSLSKLFESKVGQSLTSSSNSFSRQSTSARSPKGWYWFLKESKNAQVNTRKALAGKTKEAKKEKPTTSFAKPAETKPPTLSQTAVIPNPPDKENTA